MNSIFLQANHATYHISTSCPLRRASSPLVLLHGFTGSVENWRPVIDRLSHRDRSVIAIDILGHGRSSAPLDPRRYDMSLVAQDVAHLLSAQLGFDQVDLLGYSMGGRLAVAIAHGYPGLVRTLTLENSSPGLATEEERDARKRSDDTLADWIEQHGVPAFVDRWEQVPLFASQATLPEAVRARLRNQRLSNRAHGLANSLRGMGTGAQPSFWPHLKNMTLPIHLIVGALDAKFCRIGREMAEQLPNVQLTVVEEAGHTIHLEQREAFVNAVLRLAIPIAATNLQR